MDALDSIREHYRIYLNDLRRELEAAVEDVAEDLLTEIRALTSLNEHTLGELRDLDHPYAQRLALGAGPHPDYEVHHQSGALQEGLRVEHEGVWRGGKVASDLHSDAPHSPHLIYGTERMRPRDFASAAILRCLETAEARVARAFAAAGGGPVRDDGAPAFEVHLVEHERHEAQLPERG